MGQEQRAFLIRAEIVDLIVATLGVQALGVYTIVCRLTDGRTGIGTATQYRLASTLGFTDRYVRDLLNDLEREGCVGHIVVNREKLYHDMAIRRLTTPGLGLDTGTIVPERNYSSGDDASISAVKPEQEFHRGTIVPEIFGTGVPLRNYSSEDEAARIKEYKLQECKTSLPCSPLIAQKRTSARAHPDSRYKAFKAHVIDAYRIRNQKRLAWSEDLETKLNAVLLRLAADDWPVETLCQCVDNALNSPKYHALRYPGKWLDFLEEYGAGPLGVPHGTSRADSVQQQQLDTVRGVLERRRARRGNSEPLRRSASV